MYPLPHVPHSPLPPSNMSSHQDPYQYSGPSPIYYGSGSESPVEQQFPPSGQPWPSSATMDDQSGYSQPYPTPDSVGNLLEAHDVQDVNYSFDYPVPNYALQSTSFQDPSVEADATHTNDNILFQPFINLPFYPYPEFGYEHSQIQRGYAPYDPACDYGTQSSAYDAHQHTAQDIHTSQAPEYLFATSYPSSSSQTPLLSHGGPAPVYQSDARAARSTPDSLTLDGVNTARTDAGAIQHSHPSPVATSPSNQGSTPGPSSPERKRLLPLSTAEELSESTARRVLPRHDQARDVRSASLDPPGRRHRNSEVFGRGPLIPQERYTTSTISPFNADHHPFISFDLENPDQIGVPIIDILNKVDGFTRIRNRTEAFDMGKKTFTLRVQWPGYELWSKTIAAKDWKKSRGPITRVKLAEAVAIAIRDLFERFHDKQHDSGYSRWRLGEGGIRLEEICLVALHQVSRGSWQPELCLLVPRR